MNLQKPTVIVLTMFSWIAAGSVLAQTSPVPKPDRNGNYFSNDAPIKGTVSGRLMAGSLWQVVSRGLNCRSQKGTRHRIVRQFKQGGLLQADVGRGGADEVLLNAKDENGNPWMRVRSAQGTNYNCYVRANRLYIQPKTR